MPTLTPNPDQIQQGDVTLEFITDPLPEGCKPRLPDAQGHVNLSMGSRGGHRHYFRASDAKVYDAPDDSVFAENSGREPVELLHTATHQPLLVKPGLHVVGALNEMDHLAKRQRKVVD